MRRSDLSPPEHIYTWVDVDEHLSSLATRGGWPDWLQSAEAWWDGLELGVTRPVDESTVRSWLDEVFGAGSTDIASGELLLVLDDPTVQSAGIPVALQPVDTQSPARRLPLLRDKRITDRLSEPLERPPETTFSGDVQIVAFHSFKGGVGRTIHAVAMADAIARSGGRVLLVDADLEAPGITWMHREDGGQFDFTYEDFLALLHGSQDGSTTKAVDIGAHFLPNQRIGRYSQGSLTIVPTTRRQVLGPARIEPADLLTPDRPQYFLTEALADLAHKTGAHTVIIDLRAGASELAAPILLDPRVQRVFVTTLSHQSLAGTVRLIEQLGRRAPVLQGLDPASSAIITQCRRDSHAREIGEAIDRLAETLSETLKGNDIAEEHLDTEDIDATVLTHPLVSPFKDDLLVLPSSWNAVVEALWSCGVAKTMETILPSASPEPTFTDDVNPDERRQRLHETANGLVYADEQGLSSGKDILVTDPLRNLITDHRTEPPLVVVAGAKGAGKTFLFAKACAAATWDAFAGSAGIGDVREGLPIVPVLEPKVLRSDAPQRLREVFAARHGGVAGLAHTIADTVAGGVAADTTDPRQWRRYWLTCIAMAAGIDPSGDPQSALTELGRHHSAVFVIDGLEDLLQTLDGEAKKVALRTLVTDVVEWLRTLRGRPFGLVVFVRTDFVTTAVTQNAGQLLNNYRRYALKWDHKEALRLALWVSNQAGVLPSDKSAVSDLTSEMVISRLIPLWGRKMGKETSREARSHMWVPAALGDYNGQVQARDVVLFLSEAAKLSRERSGWDDRVLVPVAMRKALVECSEKKIEAVSIEDRAFGELLQRMQRVSGEVTIPFTLEQVNLSFEDSRTLIALGAMERDGDGTYRVPEIYRHGLGYGTKRRARVLR